MSKRKFSSSINGKGYYIALILCAVAIGISGYLYYRNTNEPSPQLQDPTTATAATDPKQTDNVQAVATQPQQDTTNPVVPTQPQESTVPAGKPAKTAAPVEGEIIASFSMDSLSYNQTTRDWRVHNGVDFAAEAGTPVCAAADGTVYTVYEDETMGMTVVIRHDGGYTTQYASLAQEVSVAPGDTVELGQTIGSVGQTALMESAIGDHVHFSVSCNGEVVDPARFLSQE